MNRSFKYREPDLYGDGTYSCLLPRARRGRARMEGSWDEQIASARSGEAISAAQEQCTRDESSEFCGAEASLRAQLLAGPQADGRPRRRQPRAADLKGYAERTSRLVRSSGAVSRSSCRIWPTSSGVTTAVFSRRTFWTASAAETSRLLSRPSTSSAASTASPRAASSRPCRHR